jgi:hypothetical protein
MLLNYARPCAGLAFARAAALLTSWSFAAQYFYHGGVWKFSQSAAVANRTIAVPLGRIGKDSDAIAIRALRHRTPRDFWILALDSSILADKRRSVGDWGHLLRFSASIHNKLYKPTGSAQRGRGFLLKAG